MVGAKFPYCFASCSLAVFYSSGLIASASRQDLVRWWIQSNEKLMNVVLPESSKKVGLTPSFEFKPTSHNVKNTHGLLGSSHMLSVSLADGINCMFVQF